MEEKIELENRPTNIDTGNADAQDQEFREVYCETEMTECDVEID